MVGEIRVDDARPGPAAAGPGQVRERTIAAIEVGATPFHWESVMNENVMGICEPEKEIGDGGWAAVKSAVPVRKMVRTRVAMNDRGERSIELSVGIYDFADNFAVVHDVALRRHGRNES